jgi:hypothetical protein
VELQIRKTQHQEECILEYIHEIKSFQQQYQHLFWIKLGGGHLPNLFNTKIGWIVLGKGGIKENSEFFCGITYTSDEIGNDLQKLWRYKKDDYLTYQLKYIKLKHFFKETTFHTLHTLGQSKDMRQNDSMQWKRSLQWK